MQFLAVAVLFVAFAASNAGLIPGSIIEHGDSAVIQGPSSRTAVHGPDGSVIAADAPGGAVVASTKSAGILAHGPVFAHAAPVVAHAAPLYAGHGVVAHHAAPFYGRAHLGYPYFAPGSGIEGQYVHDYTETLYDNGQYHGEIYA